MSKVHPTQTDRDQNPVRKDYEGLKKLEYFRPNMVRLDLPFILTEDTLLVLNMPYLKMEGQHVDAIRLLDVWDEGGYVFLKIENIKSGMIDTISWLLEYDGVYWLWSIASFNYLKITMKPKKFDN